MYTPKSDVSQGNFEGPDPHKLRSANKITSDYRRSRAQGSKTPERRSVRASATKA